MSSSDSVSIKELASKLKISDALIKKMIKDFEIETIRSEKRVQLSAAAVQTIRDILALRASGKKNKEIRQLFDESKEGKKTTIETSVESEIAEADSAEPAQTKKIKKNKVSKAPDTKTEEVIITETATPVVEEIIDADKASEESPSHLSADDILELSSTLDIEEDILDASGYLDEGDETTSAHDELKELMSMEGSEDDLDDDIEDDEPDAEEVESIEDRLSPRKIRRRQFSFRYIQRQIANDSKRVNYIKQKLRRGNISTKERMTLEDSLQHRSLLLSGWVQLLRWVKS